MSKRKIHGEMVPEVGGNQSLAGLCEMGFVVYRGMKSVTGFVMGMKSTKMKRETVTRGYPYDRSV